MSIRSSIFTNKTTGAESLYMSKGVLPPLISPTLPPLFKSLTPIVPDLQIVPTKTVVKQNGDHSYAVTEGSRPSIVVKLKVHKNKKIGLGITNPPSAISKGNGDSNGSQKAIKKRSETIVIDDYEDDEDEPLISKKSPVKNITYSPSRPKTEEPNTKMDQAVIDKRKEKSELFIGKSKHFRNAAASMKRESDEIRHSKQLLKSILLSIDAVITFIIAFDYEDKSRLVEKKLITDKSWSTLEPYLNSIIKIIRDNITIHKNLTFLLAVISLLKGACLQHLIELTLSLIENSKLKINRDTKSAKSAALKELVYSKSILLSEYYQEQRSNFKVFEKYLNHLDIKLNFPQTFKRRSLKIDPQQKQESLKPELDTYYIPLSSLSSLQEVLAFSKRVILEFPSLEDKK